MVTLLRARMAMVKKLLIGLSFVMGATPLHTMAETNGVALSTQMATQIATPILSDIKVKIRPTNLTLGQRMTVTIEGANLGQSFERLDWSEFDKHFVRYDTEVDSDRIRVKFYPLTAGEFTLKGQSAGVIQLPTVTVKVTENPEVTINWHAPNPVLYEHQQVQWNAVVNVLDSAHKISYEARSDKQNKAVNTRLQARPFESSLGLLRGYSGKTERFSASYELKGLHSQKHQQVLLNSPIVMVKNRSNTRWYFFDKPVAVKIKPLPHFLPATVPVGDLTATTDPYNRLQIAGELQYWTIKLRANGLSKASLNSVAYELISQISHNPNIEWLSDSRIFESQLTEHGFESRMELRLPYRLIQPGLVTFPRLQLRVFNPETGKLVSSTLKAPVILALPVWLYWGGLWLGLILGITGLFILLLRLQKRVFVWQLKRNIQQATQVSELWQALIRWRSQNVHAVKFKSGRFVKGIDANAIQELNTQSLGQWQDWVKSEFGGSEPLETLVKQLNAYLYATQTECHWDDIQAAAGRWINRIP